MEIFKHIPRNSKMNIHVPITQLQQPPWERAALEKNLYTTLVVCTNNIKAGSILEKIFL